MSAWTTLVCLLVASCKYYPSHEFKRDGITICTTFTPFKPENARLLVRKNDIIIDIRVMYDHSKGTTLILSKNISLLVTIKGV